MDITLLTSYFNLEHLDELKVTMGGGIGTHLLNVALGLVMFGIALGIKPENFVSIIKNPKSIITGIVCQIILLPALTFLLVVACGDLLSPMVALGMILVAACPGGNVSNFITSLSRGNSELSVSLTAFNTAVCIITTPLNFAFWGRMYLNYANNHAIASLPELEIPLQEIFTSIVIIMGIPLVLGMLCAHYKPNIAKKLQKPLQKLSIVVFIAMVVIIFASNFQVFLDCIASIFIVVLVHNLLALGIGYGSSTLLKLPYKDRRTLTIETGIQNSGLGLILLLNPNIFPGQTADLHIIDPTEKEPKCVVAEISQYRNSWDVMWYEDGEMVGKMETSTSDRIEEFEQIIGPDKFEGKISETVFEYPVSAEASVGRLEVVDKNNEQKIVKTIDLADPLNKEIATDEVCGQWAWNGGMVVITAWWGVWHIISGFTLAYLWRKKGRKEPKEE